MNGRKLERFYISSDHLLYGKGDFVYREGENLKYLYIVLKGEFAYYKNMKRAD
jgi:CRP-like cAMP-binding protein